ncbi:hypothetical protein NECAME_17802 [Necator americanus]|uniref:Uncharacterized protein n=1 Tax=Necator americanus TaxID=51031 RepID=W2TM04_NECAM|nr:hypothetical protein NECAME_17802 [Necator americanus]ETN82067.1 hypothetical protein NECAME_17802 [Necator americanus]
MPGGLRVFLLPEIFPTNGKHFAARARGQFGGRRGIDVEEAVREAAKARAFGEGHPPTSAIVVQIEGSSYRLREHADLLPDHLRNRSSSLNPVPAEPARWRLGRLRRSSPDHEGSGANRCGLEEMRPIERIPIEQTGQHSGRRAHRYL